MLLILISLRNMMLGNTLILSLAMYGAAHVQSETHVRQHEENHVYTNEMIKALENRIYSLENLVNKLIARGKYNLLTFISSIMSIIVHDNVRIILFVCGKNVMATHYANMLNVLNIFQMTVV